MYTFQLTEQEQETHNEWVCNHHCTIQYGGAIGGSITYSFTPTTLGRVIKVNCACGSEKDLTDYTEW